MANKIVVLSFFLYSPGGSTVLGGGLNSESFFRSDDTVAFRDSRLYTNVGRGGMVELLEVPGSIPGTVSDVQ